MVAFHPLLPIAQPPRHLVNRSALGNMQARKPAPQFMQPELGKCTALDDRPVLISLGAFSMLMFCFFTRGCLWVIHSVAGAAEPKLNMVG
jgi:hypothetical protein